MLALPPAVVYGLQAPTASQRPQAPIVTDSGGLKGPRQPIFFRHDVHAGDYQVPCMYCHYSVAV
jgi:hypothetical protein